MRADDVQQEVVQEETELEIQQRENKNNSENEEGEEMLNDEEALEQAKEIMRQSLIRLLDIGHHLYFFMPRTSMDMYNYIKENKMPEVPMFNRLG